jgi:hypothetical protein
MVAHELSVRAVSLCSPPEVVRLGRQKGSLIAMLSGYGRWSTYLVAGLAAGVFQASALQLKLLAGAALVRSSRAVILVSGYVPGLILSRT